MASSREPNSLCLKRKLVEDYLSEECKSRRIKTKNGPSLDSSAKLFNCSCIRPNLANDCDNFLKSGVPSSIMYYRQGSWHNFPEKIMRSLIEEFSGNKSSVVSVMDNEPVLIDFVSMTMVNINSRKQRSVAWVDDTGKCFSPSQFFDEEIDDIAKGEPANVQGTAQEILLDKDTNTLPEVVKQVVLDSSSSVPRKLSNADILRKKVTTVDKGSKDFLFVQDLFLSGMGPFATPNNLLRVYCYSPNDITAQCRLEAFERQIRSTKEERGDANVRYGWLGSRKNDIVRILINGLGSTGEYAEKSDLSAGVYLSPADRTFTSVGLCDVDKKGVQYMLLCRVILGNMEAVDPGSHEFFPTSKIYDSGVDDCLNPKCYVMWPSHLSTHMRLEYLVSFKLAPEARNYLLGLKGLWFRPPSKEVAVDISKPVMCEASEGPSTPWISFKVLFRLIQDKISVVARELLFHHDEELKEGKITREEMVKKMMIIVGEKILMEALEKIHYCPSLWYKSSVQAISSDPAKTEAEQASLDTTGRSCNHGDSCAQNAIAEHSAGPLSSKVCGALPTDMVPKGSDNQKPTVVPETSSSAGAKFLGSQGMEGECSDSPMQSLSLGNTAVQPARYQDPTVTRMPPIISDGPLRNSPTISASSGVEVCNSALTTTGPPGCASLAPTNASKTHEIFVQGSTPSPKGSESAVPILALGNAESAGAKRLNSAPRITPEGQEFLSLGIASQSTVHPAKGPDASSSAARPPVYPPGRGKLQSMSTGVCNSLSLSTTPQGRDPPASRAEPKQQGSPATVSTPESHRPPQAMDAVTKVHNAPTPITRERKDQAVAQNKLPGPGLDGCSHVDALVTISTLVDTLESAPMLGSGVTWWGGV